MREGGGRRSHTEHPSTLGDVMPVYQAGAGMKDLHTRHASRFFQASYAASGDIAAGIAGRGCDHTRRGSGFPLQLSPAETAFHTSFQNRYQVTVEPGENGLRLRIAKTRIELQHQRATRGH